MKKLIGAAFLLLVVATTVFAVVYRDALFIGKVSVDELRAKLEPKFKVFMPANANAHLRLPVAILMHGCGGRKEAEITRAQTMADNGFIAVSVDSMVPRGYSMRQVCDGKALHGHERTADLYLAIEFAKQIERADADNITLLGYSHGAWSILEALHGQNEPMPAISDDLTLSIDGVRSVIAYYPYCGGAARYSYRDTGFKVPTLIYTAGLDKITKVEPCAAYVNKQQALDSPIKHVHFETVSHGFDIQEDWVKHYDPVVAADAFAQQLAFIQLHRGIE